VKTLNFANIQKHLEYIDKTKNALNAAYHASSVALEFCSFRNLWAESDAVLIYANKCIEQGLINPVTQNTGSHWSLFPAAMAGNGQEGLLMKGVPALNDKQLKLGNGSLPVQALNQLLQG